MSSTKNKMFKGGVLVCRGTVLRYNHEPDSIHDISPPVASGRLRNRSDCFGDNWLS